MRTNKRGPSNQYCTWKCKTVFDSELFYHESIDYVTVVEKTNVLKEHLRTRLQHDLPRAVLVCAVLVDSSAYTGPPAKLSVPITFYMQTKNTTAIPLEAWIGDGSVWTPVPDGLCGNPEFDTDMSKPAP
jgi:hypothetical protein